MWIEDCDFEDLDKAGVPASHEISLLGTRIKRCRTGLLLVVNGRAQVAECEIVDCDVPVDLAVGEDRVTIRSTTLLPKNRKDPRVLVHASDQGLLRGNYWGAKFKPEFVKYVGGAYHDKFPPVLPVDRAPLKARPKPPRTRLK